MNTTIREIAREAWNEIDIVDKFAEIYDIANNNDAFFSDTRYVKSACDLDDIVTNHLGVDNVYIDLDSDDQYAIVNEKNGLKVIVFDESDADAIGEIIDIDKVFNIVLEHEYWGDFGIDLGEIVWSKHLQYILINQDVPEKVVNLFREKWLEHDDPLGADDTLRTVWDRFIRYVKDLCYDRLTEGVELDGYGESTVISYLNNLNYFSIGVIMSESSDIDAERTSVDIVMGTHFFTPDEPVEKAQDGSKWRNAVDLVKESILPLVQIQAHNGRNVPRKLLSEHRFVTPFAILKDKEAGLTFSDDGNLCLSIYEGTRENSCSSSDYVVRDMPVEDIITIYEYMQ